MKLTDFDAKAVATAITQVSERFHTRDVSEHRAMLATHGA
jgi:tRNA(His) 5'-end guanylyltransferase